MLQKAVFGMLANVFLASLLICQSSVASASMNLGVIAWGEPMSGGDHSKVFSKLTSNVKSVYSSEGAFAALKTGGEVVTWGDPRSGGNSSAVASQLQSDVITIFSTDSSFAALKTGGKVVTWGEPDWGGDSFAVASQLQSDVLTISSNDGSFAALKTGGKVVTWGDRDWGGDSSAVASQLQSDVLTIFSNDGSFAALKTGGEVVTWGDPDCGGDSSAVASQLQSDVIAIFSTGSSFAALKTGGEVATWGDPNWGGDSYAVASQLSNNVITIFSNVYSFAALKTGGKVATWGDPDYGGDSSAVASQLQSDVITIFSTDSSFAALKTGGKVVTWGEPDWGGDSSAVASQLQSDVISISSNQGSFAALKTGGKVVTWGDQSSGGDSSAVALQLQSDVITIFSNTFAFAAVKGNGKVVTWGDPFRGGDSQLMAHKLKSRVQSAIGSHAAFATLVCIPGGKIGLASNCTPCKPSEIWEKHRMECQECTSLTEVPDAEQTACRTCGAGSVPNLESRSDCTACPFFQKPSHSLLTCEIDISVMLLSAASVLLAMLLSCPICLQRLHLRRRQHVQRALAKLRNHDKIHRSFKSIHTLDFPMAILKADTFLEMQCLTSHETAQAGHSLVFLHTIAEISKFVSQNKIIFFSHQWLGFHEPDPDSIHYNCMVQALHSITDRCSWRLSNVYVWVDYTSIPQMCSYTQKGAISSLPIYASWSSVFVILAPNAVHRELGCECNLHTYSKRTWCRVECLSHYCRRGSEDMLVSSPAGFENITEDWLQDVLLIFEGDCTCCRLKHKDMPVCDKELLVMPVLAMYLLLLLDKDHSESSRHVYDVIQTLKGRMFPKAFTAQFMLGSEENIKRYFSHKKSFGIPPSILHLLIDNAEEQYVEDERELFGSVLEDLEHELPILEMKHQSIIEQSLPTSGEFSI